MLDKVLELDPQELEPITAQDILEAGKKFKQRTCNPDGWHPRSYQYLSLQAREVLAGMLNYWESKACWATQAKSVHMNSQLMHTGDGRRLIGWYRSLFRLYSLIRSPYWRAWEANHATETYFAAAAKNSVLDVGWRQAVRAEISAANNINVAIVAQDLKQCYEVIRYKILAHQGINIIFLSCCCE